MARRHKKWRGFSKYGVKMKKLVEADKVLLPKVDEDGMKKKEESEFFIKMISTKIYSITDKRKFFQ